MKKIVLLLSVLFLASLPSEKEYEFDYIIEYKDVLNDSVGRSVFYLTNSKDNSYKVSFFDRNNDDFSINFHKHGRVKANGTINKSEFYKSETVTLEKSLFKPKTIGKGLAKNVDFEKLKDTLINYKACERYVFNTVKGNFGNLDIYYTVEPETEFHLPILSYYKAYAEWTVEKNIPNGIYKELYFQDENDKIVEAHLKLVGYQPYKKKIKIKF